MNIKLLVHFIFLYFSIGSNVILNCCQLASDDKVPAFPGAQGAGIYTSGGRGGEIIEVTNLNNDGPGSLRSAINSRGPRIIVFRISGIIELEKELIINKGNLTIAGQTAPGDGICIKDYPLLIYADNVIIRYLRIRLGDISGKPFDAIHCKNSKNIIIDHCSFSWSVDECASFYDNENFTLQWSIISESLNKSFHPKGSHGYGGIWGGMQASFHHNIIAHHTSRLPRFQGSRYHKLPHKEKAEFCNNIIYNWQEKCSYGGENGNYNLTANLFKPGPATTDKKADKILEPFEPFGTFYLSDNYIIVNNDFKKYNSRNFPLAYNKLNDVLSDTPAYIGYEVKHDDPLIAWDKILENAGASLSRDSVDKRIISEVKNGTYHYGEKGIINTQEQVGGWPELRSEEPPADTDHDGMPDQWEKNNNLNPRDYSDRNNYDLDKDYTNIEYYLIKLVNNSD
ncbi:MAG: pectate lyase [Bacteroidales bacterium]|nr:MAG: pectate lyase [Bacteroidales bacterium]